MAGVGDKQRRVPITNSFGKKLYHYSKPSAGKKNQWIPEYSRAHPIIPKLYVPEWRTDMPNRVTIMKNAYCGTIPIFEHDENLFLEKREQMHYNVENWTRVSEKIHIPHRAGLLRPDFHNETSRYQSELMMRRDENAV